MKSNLFSTLYVIAAPSGGGKTTVVKKLLEGDPLLDVSISHTTRAMRPGEISGKDYFFITPERFQAMVEQGDFLEHALVFKHHYGTSKEQVLAPLEQGLDVILEIDWQGALSVRTLFSNVVSIFIAPPSYEVLRERLRERGQDPGSTIDYRVMKAKEEMQHIQEFDFLVFNDTFDTCVREIQAIIQAHRLKRALQCQKHKERLSKLL